MGQKFINWLWPLLLGFFDRPYKTIFVRDPLDHLDKKILYVIGTVNDPWQAELLCPCGCKDRIILPVNNEMSPRWDIQVNEKSLPTLSPSVWRTKGCKSHFFVRRGRIEWCPENKVIVRFWDKTLHGFKRQSKAHG